MPDRPAFRARYQEAMTQRDRERNPLPMQSDYVHSRLLARSAEPRSYQMALSCQARNHLLGRSSTTSARQLAPSWLISLRRPAGVDDGFDRLVQFFWERVGGGDGVRAGLAA